MSAIRRNIGRANRRPEGRRPGRGEEVLQRLLWSVERAESRLLETLTKPRSLRCWANCSGSRKAPSLSRAFLASYHDAAAADQNFEAPDKANAFFIAGMNLAIRDDDPDFPALTLANYMLGGGFLNSRLAVRIRQKEGLSYGVGSQFNASRWTKPAPSSPSRFTRRKTATSWRPPSRKRLPAP